MMMARRLAALAVLALLAFVPAGLRAQNPAGNEAPLSQIQLKKINDFLAARGRDQDIGEVVSKKLGLSTNVIKQLAIKDRVGNVHAYHLLPNGGMLFAFIIDTTAYNYRLDPNFKVIASVAMTDNVPSEVKEPETGARAELVIWARFADQLEP
jgi:hypothetical protein